MINRIVKMTFQIEKKEAFLILFENVKTQIQNFDGCQGLSLLEDINNPQILFTYSYWESDAALQNYRESELFASTWKETKNKFSEKAEAWTVLVKSETSNNNSSSKQF